MKRNLNEPETDSQPDTSKKRRKSREKKIQDGTLGASSHDTSPVSKNTSKSSNGSYESKKGISPSVATNFPAKKSDTLEVPEDVDMFAAISNSSSESKSLSIIPALEFSSRSSYSSFEFKSRTSSSSTTESNSTSSSSSSWGYKWRGRYKFSPKDPTKPGPVEEAEDMEKLMEGLVMDVQDIIDEKTEEERNHDSNKENIENQAEQEEGKSKQKEKDVEDEKEWKDREKQMEEEDEKMLEDRDQEEEQEEEENDEEFIITELDSIVNVARIYVGELSVDVKKEDVEEAFSTFGKIKNIILKMKRSESANQGFACIDYENTADAEKAVVNMDGGVIGGKNITALPLFPMSWSRRERSPYPSHLTLRERFLRRQPRPFRPCLPRPRTPSPESRSRNCKSISAERRDVLQQLSTDDSMSETLRDNPTIPSEQDSGEEYSNSI